VNVTLYSGSSEIQKHVSAHLKTDRRYSWTEVRKDDIQTYNNALHNLYMLMFP